VALLISSLGPGGAERVMSLLADGLVARGHEVSLITLSHAGNDFYALDPRVHRRGLGLIGESTHALGAVLANIRRIRALRRAIRAETPHTVLAFVTRMNVLALIACAGIPVRVVVSERVDPASHAEGRAWEGLRTATYQRADAVVVQTERIAQWFRARLRHRERVIVIPNPASNIAGTVSADPRVAPPFILGAGRLVPQKGFDLLIRAFGLIADRIPSLHLAIAGEGPDGQQLQQLASSLGLGSRVLFLGNVRNLSDLMRSAEAFVLSSRYEGFPNVLLEALACGVPSIAADCPEGPREILADGKYGILVPREDVVALAGAIESLVSDPELRQRLVASGALAIAPYEQNRVVDAWTTVLGQR
jgi:GalNAc-alpha-(1->4)-GalNAc-alpha-(1->3)-diNAcBac-PP-undecaprenol alpha-1,4-N-acetyl-D-galactosaminyltransferase